eukprot:gene4596-2684_t
MLQGFETVVDQIDHEQSYLDTRGEGCNGNKYCVSSAGTRYRSSGSSVWAFMSADGKTGPVSIGDRVHLQNQYYNGQTFLDTRSGNPCNNAVYFVSTSLSSDRDRGSGTWTITSASGKTGPVSFADKVHLQNGYGAKPYLNTESGGCNDNIFCVSTSSTSDEVGTHYGSSGTWRLMPIEPLSHEECLAEANLVAEGVAGVIEAETGCELEAETGCEFARDGTIPTECEAECSTRFNAGGSCECVSTNGCKCSYCRQHCELAARPTTTAATTTAVIYNGCKYRTLLEAYVNGAGRYSSAEQTYTPMPVGYSVAPDDQDIVDNVIAPYYWDVWRLCTESKAWGTKHYGVPSYNMSAGIEKDSVKKWENNGNDYRIIPGRDYYRLLIRAVTTTTTTTTSTTTAIITTTTTSTTTTSTTTTTTTTVTAACPRHCGNTGGGCTLCPVETSKGGGGGTAAAVVVTLLMLAVAVGLPPAQESPGYYSDVAAAPGTVAEYAVLNELDGHTVYGGGGGGGVGGGAAAYASPTEGRGAVYVDASSGTAAAYASTTNASGMYAPSGGVVGADDGALYTNDAHGNVPGSTV